MGTNIESNNTSNENKGLRTFEGNCSGPGCPNRISFKPNSKLVDMMYCSDACHVKGWLETGSGVVHPKWPNGYVSKNIPTQPEQTNRRFNDKDSDLYALP